MANPKLPEGYVSKNSVSTLFGYNFRALENLIKAGVLKTGPAGGILSASLQELREKEHFVVCLACGARQGQVTTKHLRSCSSITLKEYATRYPGAPTQSAVVAQHKVKSDSQKQHQSNTLKARFQTPEGAKTRQQIAVASRALMQTAYRQQATEHLRSLNNQPEQRSRRASESKERWSDPVFRQKQAIWNDENRDFVLASAAHARGYIRRTFTKPHQMLEEALLAAGVQGLLREHPVGYYRLDEALPDLKLGIEVDGCYWHGCSVCGFEGVKGTKDLDRRKSTYLTQQGWLVLRLPEHELKTNLSRCVATVLEAIAKRGRAC